MSYNSDPRRPLAMVATKGGDDYGLWIVATNDMTFTETSGRFVGVDAAGDIVPINGENTLGKILGWASLSVKEPGNSVKAGKKFFLIDKTDVTVQLPVDVPAAIATMKIGDTFAVKIVDGVQVVDTTATYGHVCKLVDAENPGHGFIRVQIAHVNNPTPTP